MFPLAIDIAIPLLSGPAVFVTGHRKGPRSAPRAGHIFYLLCHSKFQPPPLEIPGLPNKDFWRTFSSWAQKSKEHINSLEIERPEYRHCPWLQRVKSLMFLLFFSLLIKKTEEKKWHFKKLPHIIFIYILYLQGKILSILRNFWDICAYKTNQFSTYKLALYLVISLLIVTNQGGLNKWTKEQMN